MPASGPPSRVFVGRDVELQALHAAIDDARASRGSCVLVTGDSGIGKTRLVEEALVSLDRERVLWGRCHETEGAPAYWPWMQTLRAWTRRCPVEQLRAQCDDVAAELGRLVPALRERLGPLLEPPRLAPDQARFRLFDAVTRFLHRAAADDLLVVVLEDLHWADSETLLLLRFAAGELDRSRLLLVGTYRETEMQTAVTPRLLGDLVRVGSRVVLRGLDEAAVGRLVAATVESASDDLAVAIHRATDGNPFFVTEVVALLRAEDRPAIVDRVHGVPFHMPDTLRDAIRRRLDPLPSGTQRLLVMAAVLGREVEIVPLALASGLGMTAEAALQQLQPAISAGLLSAVPERLGRYRFAHALVQHALVDDLPAHARGDLHVRAAEAIEQVYSDDLAPFASELAHHFFQTIDSDGLAKAMRYAESAGDAAMARLGFEEAAGHFERALQTDHAVQRSSETRLDLLLKLGEAQRCSGDDDGARATFLEAAARSRELGLASSLAIAATQYASARAETGVADHTTIGLLEEALAGIGPDSAMRSYVLGLLATALYFTPDAARREQLSLEAVSTARRRGESLALAVALINRHFVLWRPGTAEERLALASEAVDLGLRGAHVEALCEARSWRILDLLELGAFDECDLEIARHAEDSARLVMPRYRWHATLVRAARALLAGQLAQAETLALEALRTRQPETANNASQFFMIQMLHIRRAQGRLAEIAGMIEGVTSQAGFLPAWRCGLALVEAELGQREVARKILDELAADDFAAIPFDGNWLTALAALAEVCALVGDAARAATLYRLLEPHAVVNVIAGTSAVIMGSVSRFLGVLALTAGDPQASTRHFEQAVAASHRMHAPGEEAWAKAGLARALEMRLAEGDLQTAAALHAEATEIAERFGLRGLLGWLGRGTRRQTLHPSGPPQSATLRREGDFWTVRCGVEVTRLRDTKGVAYLQTLLRHPGREIHAFELAGGSSSEPARGGDAGEAFDIDAHRSYRRRLEDLQGEIEQAAGAEAEELQREMAALERELARGSGLGGRLRRVSSDTERARLNVGRAIAGVVKKIRGDCPALGRHLEVAIRTGTFCCYETDPAFPLRWET